MSLTPRAGPGLFSMIERVEETIRRNLAADPYFYEDPNDTPLRLARQQIKKLVTAQPNKVYPPESYPWPNGSNTRFYGGYSRTLQDIADTYDMSRRLLR
jgi:hypothetical protein